ncbi:MAG: flagellar biosynthetic protein FliO [Actinomycetia bacterium]|nr:flagellar biosynthetic protein FliO [Actinomycetes bacterium]MCP4085649.1 flagellar biosynthetic protein FliO [Actinomycetes bacterium]
MSSIELVGRLALSFAIIGTLLYGFAWVARRRQVRGLLGFAAPSDAPIAVLSRQALGKGSSVVVLRAGQRHLLVGVTDQQLSLLAEGDDLLPVESAEPAEGREPSSDPRTGPTGSSKDPDSSRMGFVEALRERTVRRG